MEALTCLCPTAVCILKLPDKVIPVAGALIFQLVIPAMNGLFQLSLGILSWMEASRYKPEGAPICPSHFPILHRHRTQQAQYSQMYQIVKLTATVQSVISVLSEWNYLVFLVPSVLFSS